MNQKESSTQAVAILKRKLFEEKLKKHIISLAKQLHITSEELLSIIADFTIPKESKD